MNKSLIAMFLSCLGVAGCNDGYVKPDLEKEASKVTYTLPETHVKIDTVLTLVKCKKLEADAEVGISQVAKASPASEKLEFTIAGSQLKDFWEKRDLNVELYPNGALKTINASSSDKTAGIIAGALKFVATFPALDAADLTSEKSVCNKKTETALQLYNDLKVKSEKYRASLETSDNPDKVAEKIQALAEVIARLQTEELQLKLSKTVRLQRKRSADGKEYRDGGVIKWEDKKFDKWLKKKEGDALSGPFFSLESPRVCRRLSCLSQATMADSSSWR